MSAYLVSNAHINALLHFYRVKEQRMHSELHIYNGHGVCLGAWHRDETWVKAAQILFAENVRSLCARYPSDKAATYGTFTERDYYFPVTAKPLSAVQAIKACQCYSYQACETDDWPTTQAHALISQIKGAAINALPGYEDCAWGIKEDATFSRPVTVVKIIRLT